MVKYFPLLALCFSVGCGSQGFSPYPQKEWGTPVRMPASAQGCIDLSGTYDLLKGERAAGPTGLISNEQRVRSELVVMFLGSAGFNGSARRPENVIAADTLVITQTRCEKLRFEIFSGRVSAGAKEIPVQFGIDNNGSGLLYGEFEVISPYRGILGAEHAPFLAFGMPKGELLIRAGYEKVGVSILLPIVPRVHKQFEWYRIPRKPLLSTKKTKSV